MTKVRVIYHHENEGWWAISPDLPDLVVAGDSEAEVRRLVEEGLAEDSYEIEHLHDEKLRLEAPESARFLADLGRVARPLLMVHGFKVEGLSRAEAREPLVPSGNDVDLVA